jgi:hypothetical protein
LRIGGDNAEARIPLRIYLRIALSGLIQGRGLKILQRGFVGLRQYRKAGEQRGKDVCGFHFNFFLVKKEAAETGKVGWTVVAQVTIRISFAHPGSLQRVIIVE